MRLAPTLGGRVAASKNKPIAIDDTQAGSGTLPLAKEPLPATRPHAFATRHNRCYQQLRCRCHRPRKSDRLSKRRPPDVKIVYIHIVVAVKIAARLRVSFFKECRTKKRVRIRRTQILPYFPDDNCAPNLGR